MSETSSPSVAQSRSVAQIQNPVRAPAFVTWNCKLNRILKDRLAAFCIKNGWTQGDVADAALSDYMDNYERLSAESQNEAQDEPVDHHEPELFVEDGTEGEVEEEEFDPFAVGVPE